ncbi:MAG: hypothetical protein QM752_02600 [Gammaproteobacteria bacterium]
MTKYQQPKVVRLIEMIGHMFDLIFLKKSAAWNKLKDKKKIKEKEKVIKQKKDGSKDCSFIPAYARENAENSSHMAKDIQHIALFI